MDTKLYYACAHVYDFGRVTMTTEECYNQEGAAVIDTKLYWAYVHDHDYERMLCVISN